MDNFQDLAKIKDLFIYPIKSCQGVSIPSAECTTLGVKFGCLRDRIFVLVDNAGRAVLSKLEPTLMHVVPSLHGDNEIWVNAPGQPTLKVNINDLKQLDKQAPKTCRIISTDSLGIDCGDEVSKWFTDYLKKPTRMLYLSDVIKPRHTAELENGKYKSMAKDNDMTGFAFSTSYMMMSQASIDDLNSRAKKNYIPKRFRPNIVIDGIAPYSEDTWQYVRINNVHMHFIKKCQRCFSITVDPETGNKDPKEPYSFLQTYRKAEDPQTKVYAKDNPLLGVNFGIDKLGNINVGDTISVALRN